MTLMLQAEQVNNCKIKEYEYEKMDFGFERCKKEDLIGGDPKENAQITLDILKGQKGPKRNAVVLNSAAGLYVADVVESINDGVKLAEEIIDSGKALEQLEKFIDCTNS